MRKLPAIVSRGHTRIPCPDGFTDRQMKCAGCKTVIKFFDPYVVVCTDYGRHHWHPHCYDRRPRKHVTLAQFNALCAAGRV